MDMSIWSMLDKPHRKLLSQMLLAASETVLEAGVDELIKAIDVNEVSDMLEVNLRVKQRMIELRLIDDK